MESAHKRVADSFISLHANLDLPISIGLDVNLEPLVSLKVGIGNGGGGSVATTPSDVHTTTAIDTTTVGQSSQGSPTAATSITSANGDGGHPGGGATPTVILTSVGGSPSISESTISNAAFTITPQTIQRSKQGPTTNLGDGTDVLLVVETSGSVTTTLTRITRPSDGAVISFGAPNSLANTPFNSGISTGPFTAVTTTFPSAYSSSDGPRITEVPPNGSSHKKLSLGAIAGIVIALLIVFTGIVILICRRRRAYRRDQAALGWSTSRSSYQYQDESSPRFHDVFRRFTIAVPHRRPNSFNEDTAILSPPPMVEYARSERSSRSAASSLPQSLNSPVRDYGHRHSVSVGSTNSAGTVHSLLVDIRELPVKETAPMSAPPFSSSTSFVLSNPPIPTIQISPAPSPKKLFIPSYRPITVDLPPIPALPSSPPPLPPSSPFQVRNPFEDPPG